MSTRAIPYLFETFSRQTKPDAPAFDASRRIKTWFDPSPASAPVETYSILNPDFTVGTLTIPIAEASTLNLPGHPDYAPYVPVPGTAHFQDGSILNIGLVSLAEADDLAKELNQPPSSVTDLMLGLSNTAIVYPDDRRAYAINGMPVAALLAKMEANGVGAPGHWDTTGQLTWVSDLQNPPDNAVVMPVPLGPIPVGAKILPSSLNFPLGAIEVPDDPAPTSTGGMSLFTPQHAAILNRLGGYLTKWGS